MHPELIPYPHVSSYSVFLVLGFLAAYWISRGRGPRFGIGGNHFDNLALLFSVSALFGGRFFARLFYEPDTTVWSALKVWEGKGLVFYGAILFGVLALLAYGKVRRLSCVRLLNCIAPGLALGLAFGRIGCFLAGCCWGDVCADRALLATTVEPARLYQIQTVPSLSAASFPLAVTFPEKSAATRQHKKLGLVSKENPRSMPVHPVQLYEAGAALLLFALLWRLSRDPDFPAFLLLGGSYAAIRFSLEFLRADNRPDYGGMTIGQVTSLILLAICLAALGQWKWKGPGSARSTSHAPHHSDPGVASAVNAPEDCPVQR